MELKLANAMSRQANAGFNRTFMELKCRWVGSIGSAKEF